MQLPDSPQSESVVSSDDVRADEDGSEVSVEEGSRTSAERSKALLGSVRAATLIALVIFLSLTALAGWLGFQAHQARQVQRQENELLEAAKRGAQDLTTIDWQHAEEDVRRILDGATGEFYDDFQQRSQPFVQVLQQTQSKSVGTVTEVGLESHDADAGQALVSVAVQTTAAAAPAQGPRSWRLRIDMQRVGDQVKVSNVEFVS